MTKNLYILSGLGADERVFQHLDFIGYSPTYIKWIRPLNNETIERYATRLLPQINAPNPVLIGLSFGGIMAIEISKQIQTEKVILIASAKTKNEIPFYYRWAGFLGLHKLLSTRVLKTSNSITNWLFGVTSTFDKNLLKQILIETDPVFLKWAIDNIVRWTNTTVPKNVFHIHGTNDKILPIGNIKFNKSIKNGGHLMTLNMADNISAIFRAELQG
ncbi:MAG: alpha/beta hydrolase [Bacteroidetes bacterium]|nr:alpha/beta hydrolase [Bacteroidota bacterium]